MSDSPVVTSKSIVCLANSRKESGHCIAGLEFRDSAVQGWVRPVSDNGYGEIFRHQFLFADGTEPAVLDVVGFEVLGHSPDGYQSENWTIASGANRWVREGRFSWRDLEALPADNEPLWIQPDVKVDRVSAEFATSLSDSLRLIRVNSVVTYATTNFKGRRQLRARFTYDGTEFDLVITDLWFEFRERDRGPGDTPVDVGPCYLTISLSHPYSNGYCFKLVAAIITRDRAEEGE